MNNNRFEQLLLCPSTGVGCVIPHVARRRRGISTPSLVLGWICIVAVGMGLLWQYEHAAGLVHESPDQWPTESQISAAADRPTLLLFAHPKCPCTRASIGELSRIMTVCKDRVQAFAIFVKPMECAENADWEKSDLWTSASQIPGVTTVCDVDGTEAQLFHAATSGFAMIYDQYGQLRFRGGITGSRGHNGDNAGRSAIVDLLTQGSTDVDKTKVFGCELGTTITDPIQSCCRQ